MDQLNVSENAEDDLIHYETGVFTQTYVKDGAVYYATFHPELYPEEDGLDATGRYLVVLLHFNGLSQFYMIRSNDKWIPSDEYFSNVPDAETKQLNLYISADILDWLSETLLNNKP
jgi:hypothetical protein